VPAHGAGVHVPYRNSTLTSVLRGALASECWPVLIACVSPEAAFAAETASTCRFAARCALVEARTVPIERGGGGGGGGGTADDAASVAALEARVRVLEAALEAVGVDAHGRALRPGGRVRDGLSSAESAGGGGGGGGGDESDDGENCFSGDDAFAADGDDIDADIVRFLSPVPPKQPTFGDGGEAPPPPPRALPLPNWTLPQTRYAFAVMRDALGVAVSAAAAATADAAAAHSALRAAQASGGA